MFTSLAPTSAQGGLSLSQTCAALLEEAIRQSVRQAVLYYADGLATLSRQLEPLRHGRARP